ncbi:hypothetical protein [Raineyella fluvialis]|uniref:Alpha/beta hydrolase family protein n=1 Tax=Raineyella fluvialis TaxID=2662261 RepID=A0A5Q2FBF1_9ACTN|nr:hypothetical protein [Raineyella fluvialis]QGF23731.1 hypothetical protein Rai3103_08670 [Raineyella fluvialis]
MPRGILWGADDLHSGGSLSDAQQDLGQPITIVIPGAGHLSMLADPAVFAADLEQILATMPAAH